MLTGACAEGRKQATEQLVQMKSLMKNTIETVSKGKHVQQVGTRVRPHAAGARRGQRNTVDVASQANALLGPLGGGSMFPEGGPL